MYSELPFICMLQTDNYSYDTAVTQSTIRAESLQ